MIASKIIVDECKRLRYIPIMQTKTNTNAARVAGQSAQAVALFRLNQNLTNSVRIVREVEHFQMSLSGILESGEEPGWFTVRVKYGGGDHAVSFHISTINEVEVLGSRTMDTIRIILT